MIFQFIFQYFSRQQIVLTLIISKWKNINHYFIRFLVNCVLWFICKITNCYNRGCYTYHDNKICQKSLYFSFTTRVILIRNKVLQVSDSSSDRPNIPCSAERSTECSTECSVIFGVFSVPLFNGGTGEGKKEALFLAFF